MLEINVRIFAASTAAVSGFKRFMIKSNLSHFMFSGVKINNYKKYPV